MVFHQISKIMKKKIFIALAAIITISVIGIGITLKSRTTTNQLSNQYQSSKDNDVEDDKTIIDEAPTESQIDITEDTYQQVQKYRKKKSSNRILPMAMIDVTDGAITSLKYTFDSHARDMKLGNYGELGLNPLTMSIVYDDGTEVLLSKFIYSYDDNGNILLCYQYDLDYSDPSIVQQEMKTTNHYNSSGLLQQSITQKFEDNTYKNVSSKSYEYDENGYLSRIILYDSQGLDSFIQCKCNTNGDVVEEDYYDYNSTYFHKVLYSYRDDGQIERSEEYDSEDDYIVNIKEYIYDSKDYLREIHETSFDYQVETDAPQSYITIQELIYEDSVQNKLGTY